MEKVLFFDIPKLKPNYFLIVIGICLLYPLAELI